MSDDEVVSSRTTHGMYDMLPLGMAHRHVMYVDRCRRGSSTLGVRRVRL